VSRRGGDICCIPHASIGHLWRVDPWRGGNCVRVATIKRSMLLSHWKPLWSAYGVDQNDDPERDPGEIFDSMISALIPVLDRANECGVKIGFEPEPGMVIESLADWFLMKEKFDHPALGLTVDLGHLGVTESEDPAGSLSAALDDVIHVHIDDCRGGIHEHLPLGEGELNLQKLAAVLSDHGYSGQLLVELSRDSHRAPELVESSMRFLEALGEKRSNPGN